MVIILRRFKFSEKHSAPFDLDLMQSSHPLTASCKTNDLGWRSRLGELVHEFDIDMTKIKIKSTVKIFLPL